MSEAQEIDDRRGDLEAAFKALEEPEEKKEEEVTDPRARRKKKKK